jgi:hypothetical protein
VQLMMSYRDRIETGSPLPSYRDVGIRVFCETDEDGILLFLLSVTGMGNRRLVDIGASGIKASNSANLLIHHGWTGLLVEATPRAQESLDAYERRDVLGLQVVSNWVTAENAAEIVREHGLEDVDLLSIDIDGNDYWVWKSLELRPRIVVIEYQDILGPERSVVIPYDPKFSLDQFPENATENNYVGASLRALTKLAHEKGYHLAAVNRHGYNAFFVREDLMGPLPEIAIEEGFTHPWNVYGMRERWPKVEHLPWQEV